MICGYSLGKIWSLWLKVLTSKNQSQIYVLIKHINLGVMVIMKFHKFSPASQNSTSYSALAILNCWLV